MELRECPFCGGEASFDHDDNGWNWVVCEKCGVSTDCRTHTMEDCHPLLAEQWNRRASPASAPEGWKWRRHARTRWEAVGHWDSIEEMAYNDMLGRGWDVEKLYSHAAPTPPVSEDRWLPIETAPKDEFVLLAGPSGYTTIETVFATGRMCSDYHVGRWIDHANDDLTDWGFEPTHWMPLPKAPTMQEDKKP